jgi:hypothetical protein
MSFHDDGTEALAETAPDSPPVLVVPRSLSRRARWLFMLVAGAAIIVRVAALMHALPLAPSRG